jgi:L-ascorbate metabolism protein UlaG (beta-lactamase superfamily)
LLPIAILTAALVWALLAHPSLGPYAALQLPASQARKGELRATFMGVTTILIKDDDTAILIDGFYSRPGMLRTLLWKIGPDSNRIQRALDRAKIGRVAVVLVAHAHYDHVLDSAVVAAKTGAILVGSESVANVGAGNGMPKSAIRVIKGGESLTYGRFSITPFRSLHSPCFWFPGTIQTPFHQPARVSAYKEGGSYSFLIVHPAQRILVHPSTNFIPGMYEHVRADIVFLGIGRLGKQDPEFAEEYWREVVQATGAKLVIPVHWDDLKGPVGASFLPAPALQDNFSAGMEMVEALAKRDGVAVRLMPAFESVGLVGALQGVQHSKKPTPVAAGPKASSSRRVLASAIP